MSNVFLSLGPVLFQDFEIPAGIGFGGRQVLAVHQLAGGGRVIDTIGPEEIDIAFSGAFSGPSATSRARTLNALRFSGSQLSLTWDVFFYTVVINLFKADYENPVWVPYQIGCTVLRDEAAPALGSTQSLAASVLADVNTGASQCGGLGIDFSSAISLVSSTDATTFGTSDYAAAVLAVSNAQSLVAAGISKAESGIQATDALNADSSAAAVAGLMSASVAASQLAELLVTGAYLGRASRNLGSAST